MRSRILIDFVATAKMFFRNKGAIFWTLAFPVLLIFIFGAIFSSSGQSDYDLYVQNLDEGPASIQFIDSLNQTGVLNVHMVPTDISASDYVRDNSLTGIMIVPSNFTTNLASDQTAYVELRLDQTYGSSGIVASVVTSVVNQYNLQLSGGKEYIQTVYTPIVAENVSDIDFFLPGVIGLTVMTTCTLYMQGVQSNYFATGIFRKLSTTPMTRMEWLISRAMWQLVVVFMSLAAMLIVGIAFFDAHLTLTWLSILIIIFAGVMFTGLGMMISRFAKDEETANAAASAITFPMMFLSGSFFPLEQMPDYLQQIAKVLPLTYVNNGLRDAMVFGNTSGALFNLGVITLLATVFVIIGAYISKWTDD